MIKVKFDWPKSKNPLNTTATAINSNNSASNTGKDVKDNKLVATVAAATTLTTIATANGNANIQSPSFVTISNDDDQRNVANFGGAGSAFTAAIPSSQICCLIDEGTRCSRTAGNASYSKRIQKTVQQRKLQLVTDNNANHTYICDHHKTIIQSIRTLGKRKRKDSCEDENNGNSNDGYNINTFNEHSDLPQVDLSALQVNTLRRYKRHYRIQTRPGINKLQLSENLMKHFRNQPVIEKEAITYFIYMVKSNRNKLD